MKGHVHPVACMVVVCATALAPAVSAQTTPATTPGASAERVVAAGATLPPGYVIGTEDVLSIVFWRDKDMSVDVVVRPDGKISVPLLNEIHAAGLTPEQLRAELVKAAGKYIEDPTATVVVKEIKSRNVFVTGNVLRPGTYPLTGSLNVLQLIALGGGLQEYADSKHIVVIRSEGGRQQYFKFNYKDVVRQKNVQQNILLKPGDTVVVP